MNVLLTHGYFIHEDVKEQKIMRPYPPLGLLYISAYLKQQNIDCTIFDTTFSSKEKFRTYLLAHRPRFVGIYVNLMTRLNVLEAIRFIRSREALKNTHIILGGPEVRAHKENFLKKGADIVVLGEGEETMYEVVTALGNVMNPFLDTIQGIAFINTKGEVVETPQRPLQKRIDHLPMPDRLGIDLQDYLDVWKQVHGKATTSLSTMRGCPYTCKWCSRAVYGLSYRRRSAKLVVDEIVWILSHFEVEAFWIVDDVFTVSHKWLRSFVNELKKRDVTVSYECITRADRMNEEVIDLLKESGCFRVWIGAESGSQKILDAMDRRVTVRQVREMIKLSQKKGIQAGTFIMLGYPGETEEDIESTIQHLINSDPDIYTLTVAYPIAGTSLFTEIESDITTKLAWDSSTDRDIDFKRTYSRRYYDHAVRRVFNEVHFNKSLKSKSYPSAVNHKFRSLVAKARMWWERKRSL